jgi:hypothetical protein
MLGGLLILLGGEGGTVRRACVAGLLFGSAAALKYSNAIFALAALPLVLAMPAPSRGSRLFACVGYAAGGVVAVGALAGPWLVVMYHEFGNPVFPLMNAWFRSPYAPPVNEFSERFTPGGWLAVLSFPFRMALLDRALYSEMFAPDIRFAALAVAAPVLAVVAMAQRRTTPGTLQADDWRILVFFGAALTLWLATSANGRYGMVVLLLAGVCLVRMVARLLPPRSARIVLAVFLVVQIGASVLASPSRWFIAAPWSLRWLPYDAPEQARREPALFLTLETLPMAVLAPFVHPGSSFVNFRGQNNIAPDSPRLAALLERYRGRVRVLGRDLELVGGKPREGEVRVYDSALQRIGYRLDAGDCFTIEWRPDSDDSISRAANWLARTPPSNETLSTVTCGLVPAARDPARVERERTVSILFDRLEETCPKIFHGHTAITEPFGRGWLRHYVALDARLELIGERLILNRYRAGVLVDLGSLSEWERQGVLPAACDSRQASGGMQ